MRNQYLTEDEVAKMRAAKLPVPETLEEVKKLLEEAERDPRNIPLDDAFKDIRARLKKKFEAVRNA